MMTHSMLCFVGWVLVFVPAMAAGEAAEKAQRICTENNGCFSFEMLKVWKCFIQDKGFDIKHLWNGMDDCCAVKSTEDFSMQEMVDKEWRGFIACGANGILGFDQWGPGPSLFQEERPTPLVSEQDIPLFPNLPANATKMLICEPCNSASGMVHFRSVVDCCKCKMRNGNSAIQSEAVAALTTTLSMQAAGSFFLHAGGGDLGFRVDTHPQDLFFLLTLQSILQDFACDPVLHDVSERPANLSGIEAARAAGLICINDPLEMWDVELFNLDAPR